MKFIIKTLCLSLIIFTCLNLASYGNLTCLKAKLYYWVWDYNQDFTTIKLPRSTGVAYLAATIHVSSQAIIADSRHCRLVIPNNIPKISVIRIELANKIDIKNLKQKESINKINSLILKYADLNNVEAVQIDYDTRLNERDFYISLIKDLKTKINNQVQLSITALASWCLYDTWIKVLPIDQIVPMFFTLGNDTNNIIEYFKESKDINYAKCLNNIGISVNEEKLAKLILKDVYKAKSRPKPVVFIYSPKAWDKNSLTKTLEYLSY